MRKSQDYIAHWWQIPEGETVFKCRGCGIRRGGSSRYCGRQPIPDYCSDASPRSLLNEVVAKIDGGSLRNKFTRHLGLNTKEGYDTVIWKLSHASAEQIARACVEAHKNQWPSIS